MHLTLHLTERCNMACRYCYEAPGAMDMTLETAQKALAACATGANCGIIFFGGEPLLMQGRIWEIIDALEGERPREPRQFHYKVTTNGLLLDEAFLERAKACRLHVAMSHDGVAEAHDAHRVMPGGRASSLAAASSRAASSLAAASSRAASSRAVGTFDVLKPKLEMLLRYQPYAPIMLTVNPDTVKYFETSVRWLQSMGVQYVIASLNYAGAWEDAHVKRLKRECEALARWHLGNYRRERKIYFSPFDKRMATHIFTGRGVSCQLGKRQISVGADGTLYPCVQFVGRREYAIGHVDTGLDEARREEIYCRNEAEKPTCAECALNGRCHNKCGCMNLQTTGSLDALPPLLCEYERIIFPIADRLADTLYKERNPLFIHRHYNPMFPVMSFLEDMGG
ncbi:MAG: SPASM domain-containing protein [Kiritimatiellaeota bacterium]|nr:SPASM domain-containing protein [Kiritimatiellota bacterium]